MRKLKLISSVEASKDTFALIASHLIGGTTGNNNTGDGHQYSESVPPPDSHL